MKKGKKRTMSICLDNIDKSRILKHENGKKYLLLTTWDNDETDQYGNDFSVSHSKTKEEVERAKSGEKVLTVYVGNGRIWEYKEKMQPMTPEEIAKDDDLPF